MAAPVLFDHIEAAAADLFKVSPGKRTALRGRMRNLMRVGLFPDLPSRQGAATVFSERQGLELLLATLLNYSQVSPEHAVFLIGRRRDTIHKTAEAGKLLIFHPEGALHELQGKPVRKHRTITEIWPVGALRAHLLRHLPA